METLPQDLLPLRQMAEGLLYPSESDYPLEVFFWGDGLSLSDHLQRISAGASVEEGDLEEFFSRLSRGGSEDGAQVESAERLRREVFSRLIFPTVYRCGVVEVSLFVVGQLASGGWGGFSTTAVLT